jgi:hypothetical protein
MVVYTAEEEKGESEQAEFDEPTVEKDNLRWRVGNKRVIEDASPGKIALNDSQVRLDAILPTGSYPYSAGSGRIFEHVTETSDQGIMPKRTSAANQDFYRGMLSSDSV